MSCLHSFRPVLDSMSEGTLPCPCSALCECRQGKCKPVERSTNRERVTGSSASIQTVRTPRWLINSAQRTWGTITLDAAADAVNKVCRDFIGADTDATSLPYWIAPKLAHTDNTIVWCNPPYKLCGKFCKVALASAERGQTVVMLVLASVGSNWWARYVHNKADVYFIRPRVKFEGSKQGIMKDLAILVYRPGFVGVGVYRCAKLEPDAVQDIRTCAQ